MTDIFSWVMTLTPFWLQFLAMNVIVVSVIVMYILELIK